jgi:hypothetical protein
MEQEMTKSADKSFLNSTETLDGRVFEKCSFTNCTLVYRGGTIPVWTDCQFIECRFSFEDAAERTLNFMKILYHSCPPMGPQLVDTFFNSIRQPVPVGGNK